MLVQIVIPRNINELLLPLPQPGAPPCPNDAACVLIASALDTLSGGGDARCQLSQALAELDLAESYKGPRSQSLRFAALVLLALAWIRVNNQEEARKSITAADTIRTTGAASINRTIALESLGLAKLLLEELSTKLSRYEPCFPSQVM